MNLVKFKQFESVYEALASGEFPADIANDGTELLPEGAGPIADNINNKMLLNEGLLDKLTNFVSKWLPFTTIREANKIFNDYKASRLKKFEEIGKQRLLQFQARTKANSKPDDTLLQTQANEITVRTNKVIETIEKAEADKLNAVQRQLQILSRGSKKDRVKLYIDLELAKMQQEIAEKEIEDAKSYTSDDQMKQLQSIVDMRKEVAELYTKKAKMAADLEKKGELQDGPKLPKIGKVVNYKKKNGETARGNFTVVKDVWAGVAADGKKVDTDEHVPVVKDLKGDPENPDKGSIYYYIPVNNIEGFEDFDAKKQSTLSSNADIKKLDEQIKKLDAEIASKEKGIWSPAPPPADKAKTKDEGEKAPEAPEKPAAPTASNKPAADEYGGPNSINGKAKNKNEKKPDNQQA